MHGRMCCCRYYSHPLPCCSRCLLQVYLTGYTFQEIKMLGSGPSRFGKLTLKVQFDINKKDSTGRPETTW